MAEFFELDPVTGIRTDTEWNPTTGEMTLIRTADVEPVLDFAKARANTVGKDREGIKEGWWMYAKLPPIVILQMRAKGIDVTKPEHQGRMLQEINEHYRHLRTVDAMEGRRAGRKIFYR
jgi:hypothetical protein